MPMRSRVAHPRTVAASYLNGVDISSIAPDALRRQLAIIPQVVQSHL